MLSTRSFVPIASRSASRLYGSAFRRRNRLSEVHEAVRKNSLRKKARGPTGPSQARARQIPMWSAAHDRVDHQDDPQQTRCMVTYQLHESPKLPDSCSFTRLPFKRLAYHPPILPRRVQCWSMLLPSVNLGGILLVSRTARRQLGPSICHNSSASSVHIACSHPTLYNASM